MTDKPEKKTHGTYAEFDSVDKLLAACERVRDAGYSKTDAFTPFPVHGIDKALGIQPTRLPWIALVGGLSGATIGVVMQVWMNTYDYPYIISGKPFFSMPAFVPVSFELTILLASFGAFFGMLVLNRLPKFSNPVFTDPRFDRATDDTFFLYVDAADPRYDAVGVKRLLEDAGGTNLLDVQDDDSSDASPRIIWYTLVSIIFLSLIPLLIVARMRVTTSPHPRFHVFHEMDYSPAEEAQTTSPLFADGRAMRADVPGTVIIGPHNDDLDFLTGIDVEQLARRAPSEARSLVRAVAPQDADNDASDAAVDEPAADDAAPAAAAGDPAVDPEEDDTPWLPDNPLPLSMDLLHRGRQQFEIYCATCHGNDGRGQGLIHRRAQRILAATWVQPSSMHDETLYQDVYPDGKLFSTISYGIRKMPGYASQITARDRWAIVAYVRALQASQNASLDDVPVDLRNELRNRKAAVEQRLAEEAEQERQRAEQADDDQQSPEEPQEPSPEEPQQAADEQPAEENDDAADADD